MVEQGPPIEQLLLWLDSIYRPEIHPLLHAYQMIG